MNGVAECSVCHSKLVVSPDKRPVSKAYDRHRSDVSVKTRAFNVFLVVGDCVLVGLQYEVNPFRARKCEVFFLVNLFLASNLVVSPSEKTVLKAYDRHWSDVSVKTRAFNVFLVVGDYVLVGLQPILVYMSKVDGKFEFSPISVNFLTELAKVVFALVMLCLEARNQKAGEKSLLSFSTLIQAARNNVLLAVPALLYAINNYLKFIMQLYFNPATVKMLSNLKLVEMGSPFSSWLYRWCPGQLGCTLVDPPDCLSNSQAWVSVGNPSLQRWYRLAHIKRCSWDLMLVKLTEWEALALLLIGISVNQLRSLPEGTAALGLTVTTGAYLYTLIFVTVPSLASVYNEYALKSQFETSIYHQNLFLYGYGAIFNFLGLLGTVIYKGPDNFDILRGHSRATMFLIFNNAAQGILSSFFFKYADTILKKYSSTVATIFTGIASAILFGHPLTMNFILGISIVFISMHQFFSPLAKVRDEPQNSSVEMDYQKNYRCTVLSSFNLCENKTDIDKRLGLPCYFFSQQAFRCLSIDFPVRLFWIKYLSFLGVASVKRLSNSKSMGGYWCQANGRALPLITKGQDIFHAAKSIFNDDDARLDVLEAVSVT
ncbi:CMP-sialic acid transporter 2 [Capsicum annuum]|nr:CMP-sialic acid transporter 2 [Capsicum annuum]